MPIDFKSTVNKNQTIAIHNFIEAQISKKLDRFHRQRKACQKAFQIIATLNELIAFDNTYGHYLRVCAQLRVLCQELALEQCLIQKIAHRFGPDCFFLECFLQRPAPKPHA